MRPHASGTDCKLHDATMPKLEAKNVNMSNAFAIICLQCAAANVDKV